MQIKYQTEQKMELYDSSNWAFVLAIMLIVIGLCLALVSFLKYSIFWMPTIFLFIFGTVLNFVRTNTIIILDKPVGRVDFIYKSIIRTKTQSYQISEIKGVEFRHAVREGILAATLSASSGTRGNTLPIYLALLLLNGKYVVVGDTIWSNPGALFQPGGKSWRPQIGQKIASFLGIIYTERPSEKSDYFDHVDLD